MHLPPINVIVGAHFRFPTKHRHQGAKSSPIFALPDQPAPDESQRDHHDQSEGKTRICHNCHIWCSKSSMDQDGLQSHWSNNQPTIEAEAASQEGASWCVRAPPHNRKTNTKLGKLRPHWRISSYMIWQSRPVKADLASWGQQQPTNHLPMPDPSLHHHLAIDHPL